MTPPLVKVAPMVATAGAADDSAEQVDAICSRGYRNAVPRARRMSYEECTI